MVRVRAGVSSHFEMRPMMSTVPDGKLARRIALTLRSSRYPPNPSVLPHVLCPTAKHRRRASWSPSGAR